MAVVGTSAHTSEQIENSRHLVTGNPYSSVVDFDTDDISGATAADENATSRIRILDRVAHQIAQNRTEKQPIALNGKTGRNHTKLDPFFRASNSFSQATC